jgi:hypothetical protein
MRKGSLGGIGHVLELALFFLVPFVLVAVGRQRGARPVESAPANSLSFGDTEAR